MPMDHCKIGIINCGGASEETLRRPLPNNIITSRKKLFDLI